MKRSIGAAVLAAVCGLAGGVSAQGLSIPGQPATPHGWSLDVGVGEFYHPDYRGADHYRPDTLPWAAFQYGDRVYANLIEGVGYNVVATPDWQAGVALRPRYGGRGKHDNDGLGSINTGGDAAVYVQRTAGPWTFNVRATRDVTSVSNGLEGTATVQRAVRLPFAMLLASGYVRVADHKLNQEYYGVDERQATRSGFAPYRPGGGLESAGFNALFVTPVTKQDAFVTLLAYERLMDDDEDSPFVKAGSPNEFRAGLFFIHRFQ